MNGRNEEMAAVCRKIGQKGMSLRQVFAGGCKECKQTSCSSNSIMLI